MRKDRKSVFLITYLFPTDNSVLGAFIKDQAIALSLKYNVIVLALVDTKSSIIHDHEFLNTNCKIIFHEKKYISKIYNLIFLAFYLKQKRISIIHLHTIEISSFFLFINKILFHRKVFITEHSPDIASEIKNKSNIKRRKNNYRISNKVFCTSQRQINFLRENYKVNAAFLYNTVNEDFYNFRLNPKTSANFGFIGLLNDERKGLDRLLKAISKISATNIKVYIAGDGILKEHYKRLADTLEISSFCYFEGNIEYKNRIDFFNKISYLVLPSRNEGLAHVILEALSMGIPVITTDCGGHTEVINETNGFLIENDDNIMNLAEAINRMNDKIYHYNRNLIRNNAKILFSNHAFLDNIDKHYD